MHVLVIDDEANSRILLRDILENIKWQVTEVDNCLDGFSLLTSQNNFNLALVDWNTPKMTGLEFVKQVRSNPKLKNLLIVMTTGLNEMANVQDALAAGANEYVMKPFTPDIIYGKIKLLGIDVPDITN